MTPQILTLIVCLFFSAPLSASTKGATTLPGKAFDKALKELVKKHGATSRIEPEYGAYWGWRANYWEYSMWDEEEQKLWQKSNKLKLYTAALVEGVHRFCKNSNSPQLEVYDSKGKQKVIEAGLVELFKAKDSKPLLKYAIQSFFINRAYSPLRDWRREIKNKLTPLALKFTSIEADYPSLKSLGIGEKEALKNPITGEMIPWVLASKRKSQYTKRGETIVMYARKPILGEYYYLTEFGSFSAASKTELGSDLGRNTFDKAWEKTLKPNQHYFFKLMAEGAEWQMGVGKKTSKYEKYIIAQELMQKFVGDGLFNWSRANQRALVRGESIIREKAQIRDWYGNCLKTGAIPRKLKSLVEILPKQLKSEMDYKVASDLQGLVKKARERSMETFAIISLKDIGMIAIQHNRKHGAYPGKAELKEKELFFKNPKTKKMEACVLVSQKVGGVMYDLDGEKRSVYIAAPIVLGDKRVVLSHDGVVFSVQEDKFQDILR